MKLNKLIKLAAVTMAGAALTTSVYAQGVLITVNVSNPSAVIFTATGNNALVNNGSTTAYDGIDLATFFSQDAFSYFSGNNASGNLSGGGSGSPYLLAFPDSVAGWGNPQGDLNLFGGDPHAQQNFSMTTAAFSGSATVDLSSASGILRGVGYLGNIYAGNIENTGNLGPVIGQWEVVGAAPTPEPGTLALAGLGGVGALFFARRKK